jgi:hypothetical protein
MRLTKNKCLVKNCRNHADVCGMIKDYDIHELTDYSPYCMKNLRKTSKKPKPCYNVYTCNKHSTQIKQSLSILSYSHFRL